jgi:DNA polymerase-3 subunit epsilon
VGIFSRNKKSESQGVVIDEGWPLDAANGFVVFDIETTGLSPDGDRIIELGLIRTDNLGNPIGYWSTLVNPKRPVSATEIHGIKDVDVSTAPTFEECANEFLLKIKGQVLVAHNASFDHSFVRTELARSGWDLPNLPVVCTMLESRYFLPGLERKRLVDCVEALGINQPVQHRALGDASLTAAIFHFYLNGPVNRVRSEELRELAQTSSSVLWPVEKTFPALPQLSSRNAQRRSNPPPKTSSILLESISELMPEDLLSDQASGPELSYGLLLLESLSDGMISDEEISALRDCAASIGLESDGVRKIHLELLLALSREAWKDGVVNRAELKEILNCAQQLGLSESDGKSAVKEIEDLRAARVAARTKPLPEDWAIGEPLRVGDKVVITGCYEVGRYEMEKKARTLGVKIIGSVSGKTTMVVSDGSIGGNKDDDARRLAIRIVGPEQFKQMLEFVQPQVESSSMNSSANSSKMKSSNSSNETEQLVCTKCAEVFERVVAKGRKPHLCPACR